MSNPFAPLCEDFYVNMRLGSQLNLPHNRETVLHLFERVQKVAPYLTLDQTTYPAVVDGRIVWVVDGYTTTSQFPYSAAVTPTGGTSYQATYKNVKSASVPVTVKPLLVLSKTGTTWTAKVTAGQALTGKAVLFQRYVKLHKRWKQVKRVLLTTSTPAAMKPTVVSSATFTVKLARGTRVRLMITTAQAAPCYVASTSASLRA